MPDPAHLGDTRTTGGPLHSRRGRAPLKRVLRVNHLSVPMTPRRFVPPVRRGCTWARRLEGRITLATTKPNSKKPAAAKAKTSATPKASAGKPPAKKMPATKPKGRSKPC